MNKKDGVGHMSGGAEGGDLCRATAFAAEDLRYKS